MAKYLKALLIMLALTVSLSGMAWAGCLEVTGDVPKTVSQEAACTCWYNEGFYGSFGTLNIPGEVRFTLGINYTCTSFIDGSSNATIIFQLASNGAGGNCADQHSGMQGPFPKFWHPTSAGSIFYLQVAIKDPSGVITGWNCKDAQGRQVWAYDDTKPVDPAHPEPLTGVPGGSGFDYIRFKVLNKGTDILMSDGRSPFAAGATVRLATACVPATPTDFTGNIPIDDCTLCSNCTFVTITKKGTATCPTNWDYDNQGASCLQKTPITLFKSMNQFATTIVPGPGPIHGQLIGKILFNGIIDVYYAPDITKSRTGFTNNPQSWDVVDNFTDMGCFYLCNNVAQICGDYCCYGPMLAYIDEYYMISEDVAFKFDIVASQKWTMNGQVVKAWVGDRYTAYNYKDGVKGGGAAPINTDYNMWFDLAHQTLMDMGFDTTFKTPSAVNVCVFAQTTRDQIIKSRQFTLDYAKVIIPGGKFNIPMFENNGSVNVLPPDGKRWMGAWKDNGQQFAVTHAVTSANFVTRCYLSNKSAEAVKVWADITAAQSCKGLSESACLDKLAPMTNLYLGDISAQSVKYVDLTAVSGAPVIRVYNKEVVDFDVPLPGLDAVDRYSVLFTAGSDPTNQITNIGSVAGLEVHGEKSIPPMPKGWTPPPTDPQMTWETYYESQIRNPEVYAGVPIGPAYEPPVQVMCIQRDGDRGGFRTIPVLQGTWNANPWQQ